MDLETLISAKQVCERFGGVSTMWLTRRLANPAYNFPRPLYIAKRRFWRVAELTAWELQQAKSAPPPSNLPKRT